MGRQAYPSYEPAESAECVRTQISLNSCYLVDDKKQEAVHGVGGIIRLQDLDQHLVAAKEHGNHVPDMLQRPTGEHDQNTFSDEHLNCSP